MTSAPGLTHGSSTRSALALVTVMMTSEPRQPSSLLLHLTKRNGASGKRAMKRSMAASEISQTRISFISRTLDMQRRLM